MDQIFSNIIYHSKCYHQPIILWQVMVFKYKALIILIDFTILGIHLAPIHSLYNLADLISLLLMAI